MDPARPEVPELCPLAVQGLPQVLLRGDSGEGGSGHRQDLYPWGLQSICCQQQDVGIYAPPANTAGGESRSKSRWERGRKTRENQSEKKGRAGVPAALLLSGAGSCFPGAPSPQQLLGSSSPASYPPIPALRSQLSHRPAALDMGEDRGVLSQGT